MCVCVVKRRQYERFYASHISVGEAYVTSMCLLTKQAMQLCEWKTNTLTHVIIQYKRTATHFSIDYQSYVVYIILMPLKPWN